MASPEADRQVGCLERGRCCRVFSDAAGGQDADTQSHPPRQLSYIL